MSIAIANHQHLWTICRWVDYTNPVKSLWTLERKWKKIFQKLHKNG